MFHHLRHARLAFNRIRLFCRKHMAFETFFQPGELNDRAVYQFFRVDEATPGDYSICLAPGARVIEDGLVSAGFEPRHVVTDDDRASYKAMRTDAEPEFCQLRTHGARYIRG